jgi:hypothetical protein
MKRNSFYNCSKTSKTSSSTIILPYFPCQGKSFSRAERKGKGRKVKVEERKVEEEGR